jgi:hypothetical protein
MRDPCICSIGGTLGQFASKLQVPPPKLMGFPASGDLPSMIGTNIMNI